MVTKELKLINTITKLFTKKYHEDEGHKVGFFFTTVWLFVIYLYVKEIKEKNTYTQYKWIEPILYGFIVIGSNLYYFYNVQEKDENKKKVIRSRYSKMLFIPLFLIPIKFIISIAYPNFFSFENKILK
jgi:hypothetical protein